MGTCLKKDADLSGTEAEALVAGNLQASVDVQSKLDDIRSWFSQLRSSLYDIEKQVNKTIEELDEMKRHQTKHSERCQHWNQILRVLYTNVSYTEKCIQDGNLLEAHQELSELEATRDKVLQEVHEMEKTYPTSTKKAHLIEACYAEIENCATNLVKQFTIIVEKILRAGRVDTAKLVTVLEIVEREESADQRAEEQRLSTGFIPPGRPKKLKEKLYGALETSVNHRFKSLQIKPEERAEDKMWLVKHLERTRRTMVEDLIVIKKSCQECFSASDDIFDKCVKMYHRELSILLEDLACLATPNSDECLSILTWLTEYYGQRLMMHPELQIDAHTLDPILKPDILKSLEDTYCSTTSNNIKEWMNKLAQTDMKDWHGDSLPDIHGDGYFMTKLPVFLFQIVEQNLKVSAQAGEECHIIILKTCIKTMQEFQREYIEYANNQAKGLGSKRRNLLYRLEVVRTYKNKHLEDRKELQHFVQFVVAIANNCHKCAEFTKQLKERIMNELKPGKFGEEQQKIFESLCDHFNQMAQECCNILLDEVFLDTEDHFKKILIRNDWYKKTLHVETILATIKDYTDDFTYIMPELHDFVLSSCLDRVIVEYIRAMTQRRMKFTNYIERKDAAEQINKETRNIAETFENLGVNPKKIVKTRQRSKLVTIHFKTPKDLRTDRIENIKKLSRNISQNLNVEEKCAVIPMLSEIIKLRELDLLPLEISVVANKYKDFTSYHAKALLAMREDTDQGNISQIIADSSSQAGDSPKEEGIFSQIQIAQSSLWDQSWLRKNVVPWLFPQY